jgi:uncharacterized protein YndB with AHSA1/START domain
MGQRFEIRRTFRASPEELWARISDHEAYREWTAVTRSRLEEEGRPHRDGVGALRFLGVGRVGARERVVAFEPPRYLAYTLESGVPVRGYRAEVHLEPRADGGTDLRWSGGFDSAPPGTGPLFGALFRFVVWDFVRRLGREEPG